MSDTREESGYPKINAATASGNLRGAILMLLSGVGFTVYLLLNKILSSDIHPVFLAFWRAVIGFGLAIPFVLNEGIAGMKTRRPGLLVVRSLFGTIGFTLAILAVWDAFELTLAQFNAISFTRPLFVTILAAIVLHETVGRNRWGAVFIGFLGVIIMVMPGLLTFWQPGAFDSFNLGPGMILALISAFCMAAAIVLVKFLSAELSPMVLMLYSNMLSSLLLLPFVFVFWSDANLTQWGVIILMSLFAFLSQFCFISAMSVGDASFLSPIDYVRLPMAAVADFLVFRLIPGLNVWIGAAIIIVSTLYISWRERSRGQVRKSNQDL